jgi:hypothetical protein
MDERWAVWHAKIKAGATTWEHLDDQGPRYIDSNIDAAQKLGWACVFQTENVVLLGNTYPTHNEGHLWVLIRKGVS